jgi:hypothetical protein
LENAFESLTRKIREAQRLQDSIDRGKAELAFYRFQIEEAEKAKKDGFDRDKWRKVMRSK